MMEADTESLQLKPRTSGNFLTPEAKGMEYSSSELSERTNLADTLFSDFWPPEL